MLIYLRCLWLQYFLRSQFHHILWSSTSNVLILCVFISFPAFFMFGLWQFYYHVYRHGFIWVYSGFNKLLRSVDFFHQIETSTMYHHIFIPCLFKKIIPCLFICPVSFGTLFADVGLYDISPWVTELIIFLLSFSMYYSDLLISIKLCWCFLTIPAYFQSDIKLVKVNIFISDIVIFHSRF